MNGNAIRNANRGGIARPELLEQLVFRWDSRNAAENGGYGPAAYSCDDQEARAIHEEVRTALRPDEPQPRSSLGRLSLSGGRALAFRRVPGTDPTGRSSPVCYALVGDSKLLSPTRCLALRNWRWPSERISAGQFGQVLEPIDADAVVAETDNELVQLIRGLNDHPERLEFTALVGAALEYPRARLLVLDRGLAAQPTALAHGLAEMFGAFYPAGWDFSTYETRDSGMYHLAFTPAWPQAASEAADLIRVDLHGSDGDQRIVPVTKQLVALHMRRDSTGLKALKNAAERTGYPDVEALERILSGRRVQAPPRPSRKQPEPKVAPTLTTHPTRPADARMAIPVSAPVPEVPRRKAPAPAASALDAPSSTPPSTPPSTPLSTVPAPAEPRPTDPRLIKLQQTYPRRAFPFGSPALRAFRLVRRVPPQLPVEELRHFLERGDTELATVKQSLAQYSDLSLVKLIDWDDPQPTVHVLLDQLASNRPFRTAGDRTELALGVLNGLARLGDIPQRSYELRLDLAEALFNVAVRPDARNRQVQELFDTVVSSMWTAEDNFGRALIYRIIDVYKPLGIPEQSYRTIVRLHAQALYGSGIWTSVETSHAQPPSASGALSRASNVRLTVTFAAACIVLATLVIMLGMALGH